MAICYLLPDGSMAHLGIDGSRFNHNPLDVIAHTHALLLEDCDALEQIADGLPNTVDRRLCAEIASHLQYELPRHHQDEEAGLFPLLKLRSLPGEGLAAILDRLVSEHMADSDFAAEVAEALELMARGAKVTNPGMTGYMLRGFFERYRRHLHWENTLVLPVARLRLTRDDTAALAAIMQRNRAQSL